MNFKKCRSRQQAPQYSDHAFLAPRHLGDFAAVTTAIARGEALMRPMHTGTVSLSDLPEAFEALRADPTHCKLLLEPGGP